MSIVADLHIHSHFSRATSSRLDLEHLWIWAQRKGIDVVGTGDIAHPGWLAELRAKLVPAEDGLLQLADEIAVTLQASVPAACRRDVRFLPGGEISNIYKRHGQVRKVHNLVFAPSLEVVEMLQARLETIGNIRSDGRPILGLDSRDLLEIVLELDPACHLIPAHIWTPWFSMLGSKSGFDTVEECFGDLTSHIFALETGLSSDPPMNRRVSMLDRYTLVSNSDAHSPEKLGREATLLDGEPGYGAIFDAIRRGRCATVEFFPEEGKYHHDGHRQCGIHWEPATTAAHNGLCPVCGKPVTVGVLHRVAALADRGAESEIGGAPFYRLIPLPEVLSELHGSGPGSRRVTAAYEHLLAMLGPELEILLQRPLEEIAAAGGNRLAAGIDRMRRGEVRPVAGYDGEYGVIRLFQEEAELWQFALLGPEEAASIPAGPATESGAEPITESAMGFGAESPTDLGTESGEDLGVEQGGTAAELLAGLNDEQRPAVLAVERPLLIVAGPGTGKTRTLTHRMAHLIAAHSAAPEALLAITFTNRAAVEMAERLTALLGGQTAARVMVRTFHGLGAWLLHQHGAQLGLNECFVIYSDEDRLRLLAQCRPDLDKRQAADQSALIAAAKQQLLLPDSPEIAAWAPAFPAFAALYADYQAALQRAGAVDFDDLILQSVRLLSDVASAREAVHRRFRWISVDEYQDVNCAQRALLRLLVGPESNLCAIGDPDQAIYGFRGADRRYFLAFGEDFPGAQQLRLSRNYRSTQLILEAAQQVIAGQTEPGVRPVWSELVERVKVDVYTAPSDKAEAEYVVQQIEEMVGGTSYFSLDSGRATGETSARTFADFAVLYRTAAQSRVLVEALHRSGIPYQVVGQTPLHAQRESRQLLACLWLALDGRSTVHWEWGLNGDREVVPVGLVMDLAAQMAAALESGRPPHVSLTAAPRRRVMALLGLVEQLRGVAGRLPVGQIVEMARHGLAMACGVRHSEEQNNRIAQLALRGALHGNDLAGFLEAMALQGEADGYDPRAERVTLMTLHAAKGLEFPVVFVVGCEDGLLPYRRPGRSDADAGLLDRETDVEEERRLLYVGMTRARRRLLLIRARRRFLFGRPVRNPVSPFVEEIDAALKTVQTSAATKRSAAAPTQLPLF